MKKILLIEDEGYKNLLPLVWMRPVWELICGAATILDKFKKQNPKAIFNFKGRDYITGNNMQDGKMINSQILPNGRKILYPWDLISNLKEDMEDDFKSLKAGIYGRVHKSAVLINKKCIHIGKGSEIRPCAVLDATNGPIYIGENTTIHPHSLLRGPLYIGKQCRIAGEIIHSVIMDYVNKAHYGFLGHSYICSWVNLGAGTTNSNLKNNYSNVKVYINGEIIDSGQTFLGCFIGDHTKTAIGSMIYTGCIIGVSANLFGEPYYKKFVPSFAWGNKGTQKLEQAIETAKTAMKRRAVEFTEKDDILLKKTYSCAKMH